MLSGKSDQYKKITKFKDIKNFNSSMEQWWLDIHQNKLLTKSEIIALKRLVRFSFHIPGICYAKIQTIVAATHEYDGVGISRRTFERMLKKVKCIGLVEVIHTHKNNGKQSHNVYVFMPYVVSKVETIVAPNESINLPESSNLKDKEIRTDEPIRKNKPEFVASWVDKSFSDFASIWFHPKEVNELWRISYIHGNMLNQCSGDIVEVAIESIKVLVTKMKSMKISNPYGFYNGIIKKQMKKKYWWNLVESVYESA